MKDGLPRRLAALLKVQAEGDEHDAVENGMPEGRRGHDVVPPDPMGESTSGS